MPTTPFVTLLDRDTVITSGDIADGAVATVDLADDAATDVKIDFGTGAGEVNDADIPRSAANNGEIAVGSITVGAALNDLDDHTHTTVKVPGANLAVTAAGFTGNLSAADTTGQAALATLDQHAHAGKAVPATNVSKADANSEWTTDNADAAIEQLLSRLRVRDTTNNAVTSPTGLSHILSSGNGATGMGLGLPYLMPSTTGVQRTAARLDALWLDATNASEDADLVVMLQRAGTLTEALRILSTGGLAGTSVNIADAADWFTGTDAEAIFAELGAHPATILTVGSEGCDYANLAAALVGAAALTPGAANVVEIHVLGYVTDGVAHSWPNYVNLQGAGQTFSGAWTFASVANAASIRGVNLSSATARTNLLAATTVSCDRVVEDQIVAGVDGGPGAPALGTVVYADLLWPCYVVSATLNVAPSGSMVLDVWHAAGARPTDTESITSATPPTVTGATRSVDTTLTTWTRSLAAGQIAVNVDSAATATRGTLQLKVRRWAVS